MFRERGEVKRTLTERRKARITLLDKSRGETNRETITECLQRKRVGPSYQKK